MSNPRGKPGFGLLSDPAEVLQLTLRLGGDTVTWNRAQGAPDLRSLTSVRRPASSEKHRHVPVHAHCCTTRSVVLVESGLEHELLLDLDRDPAVVWLVAQPLRLRYRSSGGSRPRAHTPDLLSLDGSGAVTIWDVRPAAKQDTKFATAAHATQQACQQAGWSYRVHSGHAPVRAGNLRWLSAYRHAQPWVANALPELQRITSVPGARVEDVLSADRGAGQLTSALWHLCWEGAITFDLDLPLTQGTPLTWAGNRG